MKYRLKQSEFESSSRYQRGRIEKSDPCFFVNRRRIMQADGDLQAVRLDNPPERAFHDERVERADQVEIEESQPVVVSVQGAQVDFARFGVNREVGFQVFVVE